MAWNSQISIAFTITTRNNGDQELLLPMKSKCKLQYTPGKSKLQPGKFLSGFYPSQIPTEATLFLQEDKDKGLPLNHTKALNKQINKSNLKISFTLRFYNGFTKLLHLYEQA